MLKPIAFVGLLFCFLACDGGLQPDVPIQPGFGGTIRFAQNSWPPIDSLVNLWVFASQIYPLDSTSVFAGLFAQPPQIFLFPTDRERVALNVDSADFFFPLPPSTYEYVGILQHFSASLNIRSFRVVGFYPDPVNPTQPLSVLVKDGQQVAGINMNVDFRNPPSQPF